MSWYELLLTLHILGAALYLGSVVAITVMGHRALATDGPTYGSYSALAGWWTSKAHPAAAVVILIAGILMVIDADLSFGETWISLGLAGWLILGFIGGGMVGATGAKLGELAERQGGFTDEARPLASRMLLWSRIEAALLVLVITIMVAKPDWW
jgi:uncharacterized membrane protein